MTTTHDPRPVARRLTDDGGYVHLPEFQNHIADHNAVGIENPFSGMTAAQKREAALSVGGMIKGALGMAPAPVGAVAGLVVDATIQAIWPKMLVPDLLDKLYVRIESLLVDMDQRRVAAEVKQSIKAFGELLAQYTVNRSKMPISQGVHHQPLERDRIYAQSVLPALVSRVIDIRAALSVVLGSPQHIRESVVFDYMMMTSIYILLMQDSALLSTERVGGSRGAFLKPWQTHISASIQAVACSAIKDLRELIGSLWDARKKYIGIGAYTHKLSPLRRLYFIADSYEGEDRLKVVRPSASSRGSWYNNGSFPWGFAPRGYYWRNKSDVVASSEARALFCAARDMLLEDLGFPLDILSHDIAALRVTPVPYPIPCDMQTRSVKCSNVPVRDLPSSPVPPFLPDYSVYIDVTKHGTILYQHDGFAVMAQRMHAVEFPEYDLAFNVGDPDDTTWRATVLPRTATNSEKYGNENLILRGKTYSYEGYTVSFNDRTIVSRIMSPTDRLDFVVRGAIITGIPVMEHASLSHSPVGKRRLYLHDAPEDAARMVLVVPMDGGLTLAGSPEVTPVTITDLTNWSINTASKGADPRNPVDIVATAERGTATYHTPTGSRHLPAGGQMRLRAMDCRILYILHYGDDTCSKYGAHSGGSYKNAFIDGSPRPYVTDEKGATTSQYVCKRKSAGNWAGMVDEVPEFGAMSACRSPEDVGCAPTWSTMDVVAKNPRSRCAVMHSRCKRHPAATII